MHQKIVGLRSLILVDCKQLLELPPNIKDVDASGCVSLESFPKVLKKYQFNTSDLPALEWIDLSRCYKMLVNMGNQVTNPSWDEVYVSLSLVQVSMCFWFIGYIAANSSYLVKT